MFPRGPFDGKRDWVTPDYAGTGWRKHSESLTGNLEDEVERAKPGCVRTLAT
jgi:hypothetical protein